MKKDKHLPVNGPAPPPSWEPAFIFLLVLINLLALKEGMSSVRIIDRRDMEKLTDTLSYLILQRELKKPVKALHRTLHDLRLLTSKIILNYYLPLKPKKASQFMDEITSALSEIREEIVETGLDEEYCDYCIDQITAAFKTADAIKPKSGKETKDTLCFKNLPVLEPFDFNLRPLFKLVDI